MKETERVLEVTNKKDRIIPAEESLLVEWCPILESEAKGTVLIYLQLQRAAYDEGKGKIAKVGMKKLSRLCAMSAPTVAKCLNVLDKHNFIGVESGKSKGIQNYYSINGLPECSSMKNAITEAMEPVVLDDMNTVKKQMEEGSKVFGNKTIAKLLDEKIRQEIEDLFRLPVWGCGEMIMYYRNYYAVAFKGIRTKEKFTLREKSELKRWIEEYSWEVVQKTIKFALDNWLDLGYTNGYPTVNALYGFRESLVPEMQRRINKENKRGQHRKSEEKKAVGQW